MTLQKYSSVKTPSRIETAKLYGFIDATYLDDRDPCKLAQSLINGGVDVLQVRAKNYSRDSLIELGLKVRSIAKKRHIPVIINDDVDAAFEVEAEGVHLGQEDWLTIKQTDKVKQLDEIEIVGISTHSITQAILAEREGASYIGVGPVFFTNTKPKVRPVGLELVSDVAAQINIPFFAIGGITHTNIVDVLKAGATRVAVVSAFLQSDNLENKVSTMKELLN